MDRLCSPLSKMTQIPRWAIVHQTFLVQNGTYERDET